MSLRPLLASLAAFVGAGLRPTTALARAIMLVLTAKLVAVVAMTIFQHVGHQNIAVGAATISHLLGPSLAP
jgi:hypothetical protein